ncbi:hypothetical protein AGLY_006744 [Aphis glycines]|uniref:Transposable element P transposase-like GTP-binding insertion domain-containing protein n=1 Tax=Aphis glycines TaxID=307491 RepID=A0A6G0TSG3_APHGL|nr:hypothetical protein AGLY_006744 [Aphis glycines]
MAYSPVGWVVRVGACNNFYQTIEYNINGIADNHEEISENNIRLTIDLLKCYNILNGMRNRWFPIENVISLVHYINIKIRVLKYILTLNDWTNVQSNIRIVYSCRSSFISLAALNSRRNPTFMKFSCNNGLLFTTHDAKRFLNIFITVVFKKKKAGKWVPFCCTLGGGVDLGLGITYEELCIKFSTTIRTTHKEPCIKFSIFELQPYKKIDSVENWFCICLIIRILYSETVGIWSALERKYGESDNCNRKFDNSRIVVFPDYLKSKFVLDSERSDDCIDFIMIYVCFLSVYSVTCRNNSNGKSLQFKKIGKDELILRILNTTHYYSFSISWRSISNPLFLCYLSINLNVQFIFIESVATALEYYKLNNYPEFQNSDKTINFYRKINCLFDSLNNLNLYHGLSVDSEVWKNEIFKNLYQINFSNFDKNNNLLPTFYNGHAHLP